MNVTIENCPFCDGKIRLLNLHAMHNQNVVDGYANLVCTKCHIEFTVPKKLINSREKVKNAVIEKFNTRKPIENMKKDLAAEIESSDKYIREYDGSEVQKAYNKGLRQALKIVRGGAE